jgi:hypothetical protein
MWLYWLAGKPCLPITLTRQTPPSNRGVSGQRTRAIDDSIRLKSPNSCLIRSQIATKKHAYAAFGRVAAVGWYRLSLWAVARKLVSSLCGESKRVTIRHVKYWEIMADNLSKADWSWGYVATVDSNGRTIFVADA